MESRIGFRRVAVAGQDHPGGKRSRTLAVEGVERAVDDLADVALADAGAFDGLGDAPGDAVRDGSGKLRLEPGGRAEMVEQVGVGPADLRGDGLERDGLWALLEQQLARGFERDGAALFGVEAFRAY